MKELRGMLTYSKYPFAADYKQYVMRTYGVSVQLKELVKDTKLSEAARQRLLEAVTKGEVGAHEELTTEDQVLSFYIALASAAGSGSPRLLDRLARAEAARAARFLRSESSENLKVLASMLGVPAEDSNIKLNWAEGRGGKRYVKRLTYSTSLSGYLRVTANDPDPSWWLTNSMVLRGKVYMDDQRFREFLAKAAYKVILDKARQLEAEGAQISYLAGDALRALASGQRTEEATAQGRGMMVAGAALSVERSALPPCMARLSEDPLSGGDRGLYAYLAFLAELGASSNELVNVLVSATHVEEDRARVMAMSLLSAGLGSMYRSYTCDVMKSLGLCPQDCGAKTPVQAYRRNLRRSRQASSTLNAAEEVSEQP